MIIKYIHELFQERINKKINPEDVIEVFDCYDYRYGNIFYKGELIYNFYKEMYTDALRDYEIVEELKEKGLNIDNAEVIIYNLQNLRDYQDNLTEMDFELAIDYSYEDLLKGFQNELVEINNSITEAEKEGYYEFLEVEKFEDIR